MSTLTMLAWAASSLAAEKPANEVCDLAARDGVVSYQVSQPTDVTIELLEDNRSLGLVYAGQQAVGRYRFRIEEMLVHLGAARSKPLSLRVQAGGQAQVDQGFGQNGNVPLGQPVAVRLAPEGNLLVLDTQSKLNGKAGVCALNAKGQPVAGFGAGGFVELPVQGQWLAVDAEGRIFVPTTVGNVQVLDAQGKPLYAIAGAAIVGGDVGADSKLYLRTGQGRGIQVVDRTKPEARGLLWNQENAKDAPAAFMAAPIVGVFAGPSLAAGAEGRVYLVDGASRGLHLDWAPYNRGTIARYQDTGHSLQRRYYYQPGFKDCIGLALDRRGLIYLTERGTSNTGNVDALWTAAGRGGVTPSRLYRLWDNEEGFHVVSYWELPQVQGMRDVAVTPDGSTAFVLEDADNFGRAKGTAASPTLDLQGRGRLWSFKLSYRQTLALEMKP